MIDGPAQLTDADPSLLLKQLGHVAANPEPYVQDGAQRQSLLRAAREALVRLETPFETIQRVAYSPLQLVAARIAQEHGIFATLASATAESPADIKTISNASGIDALFLETLMGYLCTQYMAEEVLPGRYISTPISRLMLVGIFQDGVTHFHDTVLPVFGNLNGFLNLKKMGESTSASINLTKTPVQDPQTALQLAFNTTDNLYSFLAKNPVNNKAFNNFMISQLASLPIWLDAVSFPSQFNVELTDSSTTAFVDVAGGNGTQCISLRQRFPDLAGRVILQDLPAVLDDTTIADTLNVEKMPYDYFTPQPVRNAKIYYLRQIIHNHTDDNARLILRNQASAIDDPANSVVIVDDKILPDFTPGELPPEYPLGLSIAMNGIFGAQERRERHIRELVESAGFVVKDVRKFTDFGDSALICGLK